MKVTLNRDAIRLAKGAETDPSRVNLMQVHFKDNEMFTVDGFMLIRKAIEYEETGEGVVPAKILEKANGKTVTLSINETDKVAEIYNGEYTIKVDTPQCTSPTINTLYNKTEKKAEIALSAKLLGKVLKCLPSDCTLYFRVAENNTPVEFQAIDCGDLVAEGLIMPYYSARNIDWRSDRKEENQSATYLMNKRVAWPIPWPLYTLFANGTYLWDSKEWQIVDKRLDYRHWKQGEFGEMRRIERRSENEVAMCE